MHQIRDSALAVDALEGLWGDPPTLPARWFYDERGSQLFEEITRLPEYYLTRRETSILAEASIDIAQLAQPETLVELGSGSSIKTRLLLDACTDGDRRKLIFVPVDVSAEMLTDAADRLRPAYPTLIVDPCVAEFGEALDRLPDHPGPRLVIFLGSTIGNLSPQQRTDFLRQVRSGLGPEDHFLLGADLVKSTSRLTAAYDDRAQVTATFNRNLIEVLRRDLHAERLYADDFDHLVRWNPMESRIEMWLRARRRIDARFDLLDRDWTLTPGTEILTEISTKFALDDLHQELAAAGLPARTFWVDPDGDYSLTLAAVADPAQAGSASWS